MSGVLITGTSTEVGKTLVCGYLAAHLRNQQIKVITQKWVQTGCGEISGDIAVHMQIAGLDAKTHRELEQFICPYTFSFAASPHLAASREGVTIEPDRIRAAYRRLSEMYEVVLVEGIGGLLVPLTENILVADMAADLGLAAVVVVHNQLGCINHALLTIEALRERNIPILGLIFNRPDNTGDPDILQNNPRVISSISGVGTLGELSFLQDPLRSTDVFEPIGQAFLSRLRGLPHDG